MLLHQETTQSQILELTETSHGLRIASNKLKNLSTINGNQPKAVDSGKICQPLMLIQATLRVTLPVKILKQLRQTVQVLSKLLPKLQTQPQIVIMTLMNKDLFIVLPSRPQLLTAATSNFSLKAVNRSDLLTK